jgi:hypothetical protein
MDPIVIKVRALPRPGFSAFCRGGHAWPEAGRVVRVTPELYHVLMAESMIAKEPTSEQPEEGVLGYIDNRGDDRAHNASASARAEVALLDAEMAAMKAQLEVEDKRIAHAAMTAKLAAKKLEQPAAENKSKK